MKIWRCFELQFVQKILAAALLTMATMGCNSSDSAAPVMVESTHTHYHVHAVDASHQHSHADGDMGGHVHSHRHPKKSE
jgi:hypothetical protein